MDKIFHFRTAAIVSTGTEILQGMYPDTNAQWLAQQLCALGLRVVAMTQAPDTPAGVDAALRFAASRADLVVCSGGLGPTLDDVNREVFAHAGGANLVFDAKVLSMIHERFSARGRAVPAGNDCQAWVPEGATIFYNDWGTAPGWFLPSIAERNLENPQAVTAAILALPGPPMELQPMFARWALPLLRGRVSGGAQVVRTRTLHIYGYAESVIGTCVAPFFNMRDDVVFTILVRPMGIDLRLTANAASEAQCDAIIADVEAQVCAAVPDDAVFGADSDTLAQVVGELLIAKNLTVTTAESCTGGLIAKMLTDTPGSSAYFKEGCVAYENSVKENRLGVRPETLATYGAVSEETACEMAEGARRKTGADYAVAATGIAGPDGATDGKSVGLVYVAVAGPSGTQVLRHVFLFDREGNRTHAALSALALLRKAVGS